jgi:hypothetical protein
VSDAALPELFHATNDADSAAARQRVVARGLEARIRFRNIFYPEVQRDFAARAGARLPAIWDGARLIEGKDAVLAWLDALAAA